MTAAGRISPQPERTAVCFWFWICGNRANPYLNAELAVDSTFDGLISWADGRLLCIERETDADTDGAAGLRLVMYDCSETGLTELHAWSSADVSTDMADEAVWVIGAQEKRVLVPDGETGGYIVISYSDEEGFQAQGR